ncbi:MAG: phosphomannomutase/phosphoglucomutase [Solirubrobacteraceae bacterium]
MVSPAPEIFKAYDIRGLYGEEIDGQTAELIGRAFARVLAGLAGKSTADLRVGLGRDMRLSAPELAERYRVGMEAEGSHVLDAGMVGTEMLYYLVGSRSLDGGLMCTASHNPKAYTGAKLVREGALALSGDTGIGDIRRLLEGGLGDEPAPGGGSCEQVHIYEEFQQAALHVVAVSDEGEADSTQGPPAPAPAAVRAHAGAHAQARFKRKLKVVVDGGNGMAGPMVGPLLEGMDLELIETYWRPDGNFPDHEPNPLLEENRRAIMDRVRESGADLGIAWDGDADRCFFMDEQGAFVDGDFLTALLAKSLLARHQGAAILYDVRASRAVPDTVREAGGVPHINRVGHAFFKGRMRTEGALFGGEVSGHYYFRDFYCADSGTLPALLILELLQGGEQPLSEHLRPYRERYFISGEINSEVKDQESKMREIAERYADAEQSTLDGISIDYEDWHFNVRPSNTEPLLRLCLESLRSREDMERRRDEVLALIRS